MTVAELQARIEQLSPDQQLGQFFMPAAFINDSEAEIAKLESLIREYHLGGICFFHSRASAATNFEGKKEVLHNRKSLETLKELIARYQAASKIPLIIAIDAEWGLAMRVEQTDKYPFAITLGALEQQQQLVFQSALGIARDCREAGIHWNFAPVVDINSNPKNPVIGFRSFSNEQEVVSRLSLQFYKGLKAGGVLGAAKHFPGHGDTATDSHLDLPCINQSAQTLREREFIPFKKLIEEEIEAIMVGHLNVPALDNSGLPATFSKSIIQGVLRKEMGFKGVVVSDALNMHAADTLGWSAAEIAAKAFLAGNDILCFAEDIPGAIAFIKSRQNKADWVGRLAEVIKLKARAFKNFKETYREVPDFDTLMQELAPKCITRYTGITHFEDTSTPLLSIEAKEGMFTKNFKKHSKSVVLSRDPESSEVLPALDAVPQKLIINLVPPKVRPKLDFGLSPETFSLISELIERHSVILYLFGNPYLLNRIPYKKCAGIILGYEADPAFQEAGFAVYSGIAKAPGKIPVDLN